MTAGLQTSRGDALGGGMLASWGLFALAALIACALAALAISGGRAARVAAAVEPRLAGDATVAVWGRGLESADAATARAVENLSSVRGVEASTLEPDVSDSWVGALIGGGRLGYDGPRLITVKKTVAAASIATLVRRLSAEGITAAADDHRGARGPLERRALLGALTVAIGVVLLCGVTLGGSLVSGRAMVARRERRVALLIRLGARRRLLVSLIRRRAAFTAANGAVIGAAMGAVATLWTLQTGYVGAPMALGPTLLDGAVGLASALILVLIAAVGAALGAGTALGRLERDR